MPEEPIQPQAVGVSGQSAADLFDELERFLVDARSWMTRTDVFPWARMTDLLERASTSLRGSAELVWVAFGPPRGGDIEYLASHHARVATMAMRIGANLGYEGGQLVDLGMAGCLIDVGLWRTSDELERAHPRRSADLLRAWSAPSETLMDAVLQHHEREHGQGYPQGLEGSAIVPNARILGLVDTYARLTLPPAPRPRIPPPEAVREILRTGRGVFSPLVTKAFLAEVSMYPPGTLVRLNSGEVGRVTTVNPSQPLRPCLEIVSAPKGQPTRATTAINLAGTPALYITGTVAGR